MFYPWWWCGRKEYAGGGLAPALSRAWWGSCMHYMLNGCAVGGLSYLVSRGRGIILWFGITGSRPWSTVSPPPGERGATKRRLRGVGATSGWWGDGPPGEGVRLCCLALQVRVC